MGSVAQDGSEWEVLSTREAPLGEGRAGKAENGGCGRE